MQNREKTPSSSGPFRITRIAFILVVAVLVFSALLLWQQVEERQSQFLAHQHQLAQNSVTNIAHQIETYIEKERRVAQLFSTSHASALLALSSTQPNTPTESAIWPVLKKYLPGAKNFNIADSNGNIMLADTLGLVGQTCRIDILSYAINQQPGELFLHNDGDGSNGHIDIIVDIPGGVSNAQFLLISLGLDELTGLLRNGLAPDHNLLLVRQDNYRIELGTDSKAISPTYYRNKEELEKASAASAIVNGTRWHLHDIFPDVLVSQFREESRLTAVMYFAILTIICLSLLLLVKQQERLRMASEKSLRAINDKLKHHVTTQSEELLESQKELQYLAKHDPLTGLLNRTAFENKLGTTLQLADTGKQPGALCYIDLDQFKVINDTAGHAAGDELLRQVSSILQQQVTDNMALARLGGDEFGIILTDCTANEALHFAEQVRSAIRQFNFTWQHHHYVIGSSIGVVPVDEHTQSRAALMAAADMACYTAKGYGRNQVYLHVPHEAEYAQQTELMKKSRDISIALREDRLELYCQAIHYIGPGKDDRRSFEALIRMRDEYGRIHTPDDFIPAAERYGHMPDIDCWVTEQGLIWLETAPASFFLNINLSGQTISNPEGLKRISSIMEKHPDVLDKICFEITETTAVINYAHARTFINKIKEYGSKFALDDYGSGGCSFSYLRNLPVDVLKIDGELVKSARNNQVAFAMVESITTMAGALGIYCIAEHIEDEILMKKMQQLGIEYGQGFHFGTPAPLEEFSVPDKDLGDDPLH